MGRSKLFGWKRSVWSESGQQLVEFALVVVPLMLLLFGIIQWGLIFAARMTVRNASIIAARSAVLGPITNGVNIANIQQVAKQAVAPMLDPNNVTGVTVNTNATLGGTNAVSVQLTYNLKLLIPWVVLGTNVSNHILTLTATSTMR